MKPKKKNKVLEQVKAARKQSREEEIKNHGKPVNYRKIMESKKIFNRKKIRQMLMRRCLIFLQEIQI